MDSPYPPPPPEPSGWGPAPAPPAVCYRHADRATRLSCSSCARPICVDCTRQASVGQKCPECAAPVGRNRVITAAEVRDRTTGLGGAPVVRALLYVTVAIGALGIIAPAAAAPIVQALYDDVVLVSRGEVWRAVTAALLHRDIVHLGFNMYALFLFGPDLERRFGSLPFGLFYVASAAAGGLAFQLLRDSGAAVGASGAIFGLFGAYVVSAFLARSTAAGRAGLRQLMPLLLLNLALPLFLPGIAWEAHVGGLAAGGLMMLAWRTVAGEDRPAQVGGGDGTAGRRAAVGAAVLVVCVAALLLLG